MTAQTFTKPVVTIPRQPAPRYEGLFLEPAWLPIDEDPADAEEGNVGDNAVITYGT